jgi:hypothetical protein
MEPVAGILVGLACHDPGPEEHHGHKTSAEQRSRHHANLLVGDLRGHPAQLTRLIIEDAACLPVGRGSPLPPAASALENPLVSLGARAAE